jgi:hypothetical protein
LQQFLAIAADIEQADDEDAERQDVDEQDATRDRRDARTASAVVDRALRRLISSPGWDAGN